MLDQGHGVAISSNGCSTLIILGLGSLNFDHCAFFLVTVKEKHVEQQSNKPFEFVSPHRSGGLDRQEMTLGLMICQPAVKHVIELGFENGVQSFFSLNTFPESPKAY